MKTILATLTFTFLTTISIAQNTSETPIQNISTDSSVVYRLFSTKNIYNFILLDQIDGRTWQVQWSIDKEDRMVIRIY
ncbi:hypothetical protein [Winogradskyella psychrotolerans]|uniref:hypothetical protein n=1 Tax=Winogradskyella psychrotolerans TaxID=1344585 RepID=UPI001C07A681|nr:hypothetical protein [Winogradskyella psychrotolerans]MBU2928600.1 hypothetical protein [Winogradskyella psychrotolerans]